MNVQSMLDDAYRPLADGARECIRSAAPGSLESLNGPFLVASNAEYEASSPRVVVVGQENNGWMREKDTYAEFLRSPSTDNRLQHYREFVRLWPYKSGVFFQHFAEIRRAIRADAADKASQSVLWTNLFKLNHDGKCSLDSPHRELLLKIHGQVFSAEIAALCPDVLIFLTGPRYDEIIRTFFAEETLTFSPLGTFSDRQVAKITGSQILPSLTFRTYHPGFVHRNRGDRKKFYEAILQQVAATFRGVMTSVFVDRNI